MYSDFLTLAAWEWRRQLVLADGMEPTPMVRLPGTLGGYMALVFYSCGVVCQKAEAARVVFSASEEEVWQR